MNAQKHSKYILAKVVDYYKYYIWPPQCTKISIFPYIVQFSKMGLIIKGKQKTTNGGKDYQ